MSACKCGHEIGDHSDRAVIACSGKGEAHTVRYENPYCGSYEQTAYTCFCQGWNNFRGEM